MNTDIADNLPGDEYTMRATWFWETGRDSRYKYISNSFESITGIPLSKARGLPGGQLWLTNAQNRQSVACMRRLMEAQCALENIELLCTHPDGTERTLQIFGEPTFDQKGKWQGYRGVGTDISTQKQAEAELRHAKRAAEQAASMGTRFLTAASHDLQQPLQTISTVHSLLANMVVEPCAQRHISALGETVASMRTMLHALLDVTTRSRTAILAPRVRSFCVGDLLARMQSDFCYPAANKGLRLHIQSAQATLRSDPDLLQEIIRNLLANAIKYTERGKVLLGCRRRGSALRIEVWDTGIGIAEDQRQQIFEEFYQLKRSRQQPVQGVGLGLAIAEQLTRLLGLTLDFRSTPGKGSVFAVTVPLAQPLKGISWKHRDQPKPNTAGQPHSILYVEDNPAVSDAMQYLLSVEGFKVLALSSGRDVRSVLLHRDFRPDIIVSDYRLPAGITGADVIESVWHKFGASIPAIVMSGDSSKQSAIAADRLGCELLHKPVHGAQLVHTIRRLLDTREPVAG